MNEQECSRNVPGMSLSIEKILDSVNRYAYHNCKSISYIYIPTEMYQICSYNL